MSANRDTSFFGPDLFTAAELEKRRSRSTDPATSRIAARKATRNGTLAGHKLAIVRALCRLDPDHDATCGEIARAVNEARLVNGAAIDHVAVDRRMKELIDAGAVVVRRERACGVRGTPMRAYALGGAQRSAMEGGGA